jgi:hypothetical protein
MFVLMGDFITVSGMAHRAFNVIDKLLGRLPARIAVLTLINAMLFGAVSGSSMAYLPLARRWSPKCSSVATTRLLPSGQSLAGSPRYSVLSILAVVYASSAIFPQAADRRDPSGVMIGGMFIL